MLFKPEYCPFRYCGARDSEEGAFYQRWGYFSAKRHNHRVPRFRCRHCRRTFSRQTFRYDYRQRLAHIDALILRLFISGVGLRQSARILGINRKTVALKLKRIAAQCRAIHDRVARDIKGHRHLQFDELETFERCRLTMPVTMGVLVDVESRFILEHENGTMGPRGNLSQRGLALARKHAEQAGPRRNESREVVASTFNRAQKRLAETASIELTTDRKTTYPRIAISAFGSMLRKHMRVSGRLPRGPGSILHPINLTLAMLRDGLSRLRRRSWLASKCRHWLRQHAWIYVAYRNYVRPRFNSDEQTPGMMIGVQRRRWRFEELVSWNAELCSCFEAM